MRYDRHSMRYVIAALILFVLLAPLEAKKYKTRRAQSPQSYKPGKRHKIKKPKEPRHYNNRIN